jgi:hypothetical protein
VRRQSLHSIEVTSKVFKTNWLLVEMAVLGAVRGKVVMAKSLWIKALF